MVELWQAWAAKVLEEASEALLVVKVHPLGKAYKVMPIQDTQRTKLA